MEPHSPSLGLDCGVPVSVALHTSPTPAHDTSEDVPAMKPLFLDFASQGHQRGSCSHVSLASLSDEQLQAGIPQEFVEESDLPCVDDLFADLQTTGQDFSEWDAAPCAWSAESWRSIEAALLSQENKDLQQQNTPSCRRDDESASQMFAQWVQSNSHQISLSDLRKIKLKTSTIENATRQLGGGKKGLMLFLRFVLMWVQNSRWKLDEAVTTTMDSQLSASLVSQRLRPSMSSDWMAGARQEQPLPVDHCGFHAYGKNSRSPLNRTDFYDAKHSSTRYADISAGSCLSASGYSNDKGLGSEFEKDVEMQQQHYYLANPSAVTRAARKSRMERQRWSVRHHRRRPMSANRSQHSLTPAASFHQISSRWPQVTLNASPSRLHASASNDQLQLTGEQSILELQPTYRRAGKTLRLLFQKELKQSDVGSLGRIVLPKKEAETFLPPLELRDVLNLLVEDMNSSKVWNMRYRFWPNNRSRMYLLENTSDFVKFNDLREGDFMMMFCEPETGKLVIKGGKGPGQAASRSGKENDPSILDNEAKESRFPPQAEANCCV